MTRRDTETATATASVTRLEAEIANLPADIEAAEIAGDETKLSSLLARERILARQVVSARREALEAEIAELEVQLHTARVERDAADVKIERFELAVAVDTEAVNRIRLAEGCRRLALSVSASRRRAVTTSRRSRSPSTPDMATDLASCSSSSGSGRRRSPGRS